MKKEGDNCLFYRQSWASCSLTFFSRFSTDFLAKEYLTSITAGRGHKKAPINRGLPL